MTSYGGSRSWRISARWSASTTRRRPSISSARSSPKYGTLTAGPDGVIEFCVDDRIVRSWSPPGPEDDTASLLQRCLVELTQDGWRPISHDHDTTPASIILARVPYTAGAKLPTHGTLRYLDDVTVVLSVSGAIMRRWSRQDSADDVFERALSELSRSGWRVVRRHAIGATLVRG